LYSRVTVTLHDSVNVDMQCYEYGMRCKIGRNFPPKACRQKPANWSTLNPRNKFLLLGLHRK
ncbi:hypothetical protein, partial [Heyndrickxia ginsengihumi]|uniref:hypothetical protein n=1 Tax=Heyndrickxia ginsengihumi TaxID=363870 RepID=UPI003D1B8545